jgi:hypothetical protein
LHEEPTSGRPIPMFQRAVVLSSRLHQTRRRRRVSNRTPDRCLLVATVRRWRPDAKRFRPMSTYRRVARVVPGLRCLLRIRQTTPRSRERSHTPCLPRIVRAARPLLGETIRASEPGLRQKPVRSTAASGYAYAKSPSWTKKGSAGLTRHGPARSTPRRTDSSGENGHFWIELVAVVGSAPFSCCRRSSRRHGALHAFFRYTFQRPAGR